ncbi:MAG: TrkH family potassium uptake protein [Eubacteriales bacterium]|jgi:trk system potassium uptake protein TrkH|nr:TrkH family potassium uptake protein [Eubacteriales bacterium]
MWQSFKDFERKIFRFYKTQTIMATFIVLILLGTFLLNLPIASKSGNSVGFIDALFTSTSATCVTGLVLFDTYAQWTLFGQIVILCLIKVGGLGFMSMATMLSLLLRRTISLSERLLIKEALNYDSMGGIVKLAKHILIGSFLIEGIGAFVLSFRFIPEFGFWNGIYKSVFHSISAFCNAGFDILGQNHGYFTSLVPYVKDPLVILTVAALVIVGGIGFYVWEDIINYPKKKRLTLHTKIVLTMTGILLSAGTILIFAFEHSNPQTLGTMGFGGKLLASFFQSVTSRTAGYFSVDQASLTSSSKILTMILMFIGGSPGSTAGGIKTVTFGVLIFTAHAVIRGSSNVNIFERRISHSVVYRSLTIIMAALAFLFIGVISISYFEKGVSVMPIAFEVVSAFATVGISAGLTPFLGTASKLIIIILMFMGRIGVFTFALGLMRGMNSGQAERFLYPEENIMVG